MRIAREVERGPVRLEVLDGGREVIDRLAPAWRALCAEGPCDEPFYQPEWIGAHVETLGAGRPLRVITAWRGSRLRAVLPLEVTWGRLRGIPVRRLRGAASVHSCRFDLVHGAGDAEEAGRAIWAELRRAGGWDVIEIPDVPEGGLALSMLRWAQADGHAIGTWESMRSPYVHLPGPGGTMEQVLAQTDTKFRANVRRRRRKLEGKGEVRFERVDRSDPAVLAAFYELERSGWKGERGTAIECDPATRRFYDQVATWAASRGCLSLYALRLDGQPVAMHYGITWGDRYFLPKPAFDETHKECSPGQLLMQEVLGDCAERGLREFDFLGPWMEWKADWTHDARVHNWCFVFRQGLWGRALHAVKFGIGNWIRGG